MPRPLLRRALRQVLAVPTGGVLRVRPVCVWPRLREVPDQPLLPTTHSVRPVQDLLCVPMLLSLGHPVQYLLSVPLLLLA
jgi:hypothetical protein